MNRLIRYLDQRSVYMTKGKLWFSFILYLFNGSMFTLTARKYMLAPRRAYDFWPWLEVAVGSLFFLYASLDACLLIRKYCRHSSPLPPRQA
jgi:hypothetical protein